MPRPDPLTERVVAAVPQHFGSGKRVNAAHSSEREPMPDRDPPST